jgi:hypothetical protein
VLQYLKVLPHLERLEHLVLQRLKLLVHLVLQYLKVLPHLELLERLVTQHLKRLVPPELLVRLALPEHLKEKFLPLLNRQHLVVWFYTKIPQGFEKYLQ